jgi:hypothetical protein
VRLQGLGEFEKCSNVIGGRTYDLPACSIVPQSWYRVHRPEGKVKHDTLYSQSQSPFTADSQSVSQYALVPSPLCGRLTRYCFLFKGLGLEFVVLSPWGTLSDERPGLSFVKLEYLDVTVLRRGVEVLVVAGRAPAC